MANNVQKQKQEKRENEKNGKRKTESLKIIFFLKWA